jgi:hypothetical protein
VIHRLDASGPDLALHVEVERPDSGPVRYELVASGDALGPGFVVVRAADIGRPRHDRWEFRADGLWTELIEEEPGRWTLGLEAFGLRVDDPAADIGDRLAVGYDLDVDDGMVHGDLLIGTAVLAIELPATFV